MRRKYFVFISSTQDDLKAERREMARIVTELGAIPILMDGFDITQTEDRSFIHKAIEECDYFLNLTAHTGGKAIGKTFALELEYIYAARARIPVIALIVDEKARRKSSRKKPHKDTPQKDSTAEKDETMAKAVAAFKKKLENHPHARWSSSADLRPKAMNLLTREMNLKPRNGWIPGDEAFTPAVANELSRLSRENDTLRNRLAMEDTDIVEKLKTQVKSVMKVLASYRIPLSFYYVDGDKWENSRTFRYLHLFRLIAPELSTPKTTVEISHFLGNIINPDLDRVVRKDYPTPSNTIKKIMSDFSLLKLAKCAPKLASNDPVNDEDWELTEFGKEVFAAYRLRQMSRERKPRPRESENMV